MICEPAREPVEREAAEVVLGDAEHVGVAAAGRLERLGDGRQQLAQRGADDVGLLGVLADRLAQEPDAVADVARLVVVDQRVALDEARAAAFSRRGSRSTNLNVVRPSVASRTRW